ncbi:undecaprenyldiphospho-muramoylpentapeptide beta-N-acetylglucosaminyltransferase [Simiduia curdlanivorans]|uniref:UDP-N-acetylglucosamine--N-acetylmuramyl-(pentapeptide) pyrophosphoryl-undecaprenol N-acetylglucosamine transferase n=1 Tax=Simiduia curdlanivorans TaxID=1492769 RepID=A0ABV8V6X1_9GAMM|nr:undecaprenyldiphospho-muramoylpentapeptide beta-N-acetylglucosaminyltransferase [Simiduia curdlanivorans]MDN3638971.1 undecaprenyldiphospho-muramoylpentapeptide beta-N-acetylglucosaminyltransferase [Simiduia curdlanivorans]
MTNPRVLIMAGGTGGHVFPALAVASALKAGSCDVQWLGTQRGIEAQLVPAAGILLHVIKVEGLRGKGIRSLLLAPAKLLVSLVQAAKVLRRTKPKLVLGFGGFASGPGGLVAWLFGIPLIIHEQNARLGTTNKLLSKVAQRRLQAFESGMKTAETVGNPVRQEICSLAAPDVRFNSRQGPLKLLVLGGSLGAQFINDLLPKTVALMPAGAVEVYHQSGAKHFDVCANAYASAGLKHVRLVAFIDDMADAYGWADMVICRSGALTVSEISVAGLPALFIPFPFAIDDHQTANANWLVNHKAALVKQQSELNPQVLADVLTHQLADRKVLLEMALNARAQAKADAAQAVAKICQEVLRD